MPRVSRHLRVLEWFAPGCSTHMASICRRNGTSGLNAQGLCAPALQAAAMTDSLVGIDDDLDELNNRAEIIKARELYTLRIRA